MPRRIGRRASLVVAALAAFTPWSAPAPARAAEAEVRVELDQDTVSVDEPLTVRVIVTSQGGGIQRIDLPESAGLALVGRSQSQQSSFSLGPGGLSSSHSTVYRLTYQASRPGDYALSPAKAVIDGHSYESESLQVKVLPAGKAPHPSPAPRGSPFSSPFNFPTFPPSFPPGSPDEEQDPFADLFNGGRPPGDSDIFLAAGIDHRQVFLGQQITYTLKLYTRVNVSEFNGIKLPGFDGFWGEDLESPTHPAPSLQTVGGVTYQAYLIKKRALFPSRAGALTLGPAEADISAGGVFFRGHKVHRASAPITVTVLPLPAGAPAGFSTSNVGQWRLAASLMPAAVPVGEPATLVLAAEGLGNLHALILPSLPAIPGLRTYDPTSTDKPAPQDDRFGGRRRVEIVIIPERTGIFEIPPLEFSSFDPIARKYQTQTTQPLELQVTAGGKAGVTGAPGAQNLLEAGYRPIRPMPHLRDFQLPELPAAARPVAVAVPPSLLGIALLTQGIRRRRERAAPGLKIRRAYRVAHRRLKAAAALVAGVGTTSRADQAYGAVAGALLGYLEDRISESLGGLPRPELAQRLREVGASAAAVGATLSALESCEHQRYAPAGHGVSDADLIAQVEAALDALERCKLQSPPSPA
jgi:hypothetical protein